MTGKHIKLDASEIGLYFHIPFCVRKCYYCDFLSAPADAQTRVSYMEALRRETAGRAAEYAGRSVTSIFIGGGTPSVLEGEQLADLLREVREHYAVRADAEITVEVNPGTVDLEKLKTYRRAGINRLSIGLQSADEKELKAIGRIHGWRQFLDAYGAAVQAGFENINVDVMSALPGQTIESYAATLQRILDLKPQPTHISAYSLILEEGTVLWEQVQAGSIVLSDSGEHLQSGADSRCECDQQADAQHMEVLRMDASRFPDEETEREMYSLTKRILGAAGYGRYEISNYARPGYECRHNSCYWRRKNYAGYGIGAASLIDNTRFQNRKNLQDYMQDPLDCRENIQILSPEEQMEEFMFLGLRMTEGVSLQDFASCFGKRMEDVYGGVIERSRADGLLEWRGDGSLRRLALTERGLDLANYVMAEFLLS